MAVRDKCVKPLQYNKLIDTTWLECELSALSGQTTVIAWAGHADQVASEATVRARPVTRSAFSWPTSYSLVNSGLYGALLLTSRGLSTIGLH